ncbi:PCMD domain-containing protein [Jejuia pallidilutea]|nr:PCMD domain-containing protein [Jejuia pallidilutea]
MKQIKFIICLVLSIAMLHSCIEEDKFGFSSFKAITAFQLPMQDGTTTINAEELLIEIPIGEGVNLENIVPSNIEISNLATISPLPSEPQDFTNPVLYTVTAEDNTTAIWTVTVVSTLPNPQLPNSNFDLWYAVGDYQQPGESEDTTVWGTANRALAIAGDANTNPEDLGNGDFAVNLTSVAAPLLVRMAAATLFTGKFTDGFPNPADPRSNIDFGTPFSGKPNAFRLDYTYIPGESYEDEDGNVIPGSDQCDIYVLLEKREGDVIERIGTGWFRSDTQVDTFTNLEVDIIYGELDSSLPQFEYANIRDDEVWGNAEDTPTHITVVFSSSALGDFFTGAIGSELRINNFELVY